MKDIKICDLTRKPIIINGDHLLNDNQHYHTKHTKKRIVLHHTAGGTAKSSIDWWNLKPNRVCTAFIIPRDGRILQLFDPAKWAYALGTGDRKYEQESIQIEIANYGWLTEKGGKFYRVGNKLIEMDKVQTYKEDHRGYYNYEEYTEAQVIAVAQLCNWLNKEFKLGITAEQVHKFWWYNKRSRSGLVSHTTVRKDKSDIHPQPNLIKSLYDVFGCTKPVTE